jgi:hypothetical protein
MTTLLAALLLFLLAFLGMALGVIMKRASLRRGCGSSREGNCCQKNATLENTPDKTI